MEKESLYKQEDLIETIETPFGEEDFEEGDGIDFFEELRYEFKDYIENLHLIHWKRKRRFGNKTRYYKTYRIKYIKGEIK